MTSKIDSQIKRKIILGTSQLAIQLCDIPGRQEVGEVIKKKLGRVKLLRQIFRFPPVWISSYLQEVGQRLRKESNATQGRSTIMDNRTANLELGCHKTNDD